MKHLIMIAMLLGACGREDDKKASEPEEVTVTVADQRNTTATCLSKQNVNGIDVSVAYSYCSCVSTKIDQQFTAEQKNTEAERIEKEIASNGSTKQCRDETIATYGEGAM